MPYLHFWTFVLDLEAKNMNGKPNSNDLNEWSNSEI